MTSLINYARNCIQRATVVTMSKNEKKDMYPTRSSDIEHDCKALSIASGHEINCCPLHLGWSYNGKLHQ